MNQYQIYTSVKTALIGAFWGLFGKEDTIIEVFMIIVFLDMLIGILASFQNGKYSSSKFKKGLLTKIGYFAAIILVVQLDRITNMNGLFRGILITFLIANEMISIIENLGDMGVPFPKQITNAIELLKKQSDKDPKE